jgi:hypothetical protein
MSRWKFSVEQDGMEVASGEAPTEAESKREAGHYAMMYAQDGPVKVSVKEVRGTHTLPREGKAQDTLAEIFEPTIPMSVEYFLNERMSAMIKQLDQEIVADFRAAMRADFEGSPSRTYDGILRMEESKHGVEAGGAAGEDRRTVEAVSKGDDGVESGAVGVGEKKGVDG